MESGGKSEDDGRKFNKQQHQQQRKNKSCSTYVEAKLSKETSLKLARCGSKKSKDVERKELKKFEEPRESWSPRD